MDEPTQYTCGVIKADKSTCGEPAVDYFSISDPTDETYTRIVSIILLCEKHSKGQDDGKVYYGRGDDGKIYMFESPANEPKQSQK